MVKIMKKFATMAVLLVFILSIMPSALAGNGQGNQDVEEIVIKGLGNSVEVVKKVRDKLGNEKEILMQKTQTAQAKLGDIIEKQQALREKFLEAKEKHLEQRKNLVKLQVAAKRCKGDVCLEKKFSLKVGVKNHLLRTLDVMEKHLERTRLKLAGGDQTIVEGMLDKVFEQREKVKALNGDSTAEEIREVIKETKNLWREVKEVQREVIAQLIAEKTEKVVEKHHGLVKSMNARIKTIERLGGDTTELEEIKARFIAQLEVIDAAHDTYKESREEWKNSDNKKNSEKKWRERHREERNEMKEARKILREFVVKFNEIKQNLLGDIGDEVEEEETEDEEEPKEDEELEETEDEEDEE